MIRRGCDRLLREAQMLAGRRYGLLAHGASITAGCRPLHLALAASPAGPPAALFGPEHGYYGVEQDMVASGGGDDPWTGVPVVSLYGDSADSLRPRPEAFVGLEVLLIDLQDVGCRYYTYAATAVWAAEVALAAGLEVWVLDRPNPLGGVVVEGGLPRPGYESFVGAFRIPVRHGLTLGELMRLESRRRGWSAEPRIWTLEGWRRDLEWCGPWIAPSPNMPAPATAVVYPGSCLIEATALSEGRGTTRPFQLIGAPGLDPPALAVTLERCARELPGVTFLPTCFRPQFQKHRGEICGGVEVVVTDPRVFPAYRCGVELLAAIRGQLGDGFAWREAPYEFVSDRPAIDLLTGGCELREALAEENGPDRVRLAEWIAGWRADEEAFREERRAILLYPEVS
ncbi:MAG: DUF1343 domain-containing protein [bacterium]|nr:DUF1343 domain-containing protein [bacterium]